MNPWITKSRAGGGLLLLVAAGGMLRLHSRDDHDDARAGGGTNGARISAGTGEVAETSLVASGERHVPASKESSSQRRGSSAAAVKRGSGDDDSLEAPLARTKVRDRPMDEGERSNKKQAAADAAAHPAAVVAGGNPSKEAGGRLAKTDASSEGEAPEPAPMMVKPAVLPLVYQLSDEELLAHSPGVRPEVLEPIRDQFEQDAGVGKLDTADPEYARRWNIASPSADERYRTLFGWAAYGDMTRRAAAARAAQAAAASPQQ